MDFIYAILLTLLESTFIFVTLALLHNQRKAIGRAPFYMAFGLLILFTMFMTAADCRVNLFAEYEFQVASTSIFIPLIAALLMIYCTEGTLAAQHLIIGSAVLYGLFLYLGEIARLECGWLGFSIQAGPNAAAFENLLANSGLALRTAGVMYIFSFLLVPVIYTRLRTLQIARPPSILISLCASRIISACLILCVHLFDLPSLHRSPELIAGNLGSGLALSLWLGLLLSAYLAKLDRTEEEARKSPLDLIFAFFGGYGRSKQLEQNLREWEERYQLVLENAGEMILMLNAEGEILDANHLAARFLGTGDSRQLIGKHLFPRLRFLSPENFDVARAVLPPVLRFKALLDEQSSRSLILSGTISQTVIRNQTMLILIAADITEETRLAEERARLSETLAHSQRLESLGMLAGGVAHDFNNYIHAIIGHVDVINMLYPPENPDAVRHLGKVGEIAEQAGHLTRQLLGFARKGKYQLTTLSALDVLQKSFYLIGSQSCNLTASIKAAPGLPPFKGDAIQLQQVILNLLLNAIYAMQENAGEKRLELYAGPAREAPVKIQIPPDIQNTDIEDYLYLSVSDNGSGMTEEVQKRLFEPFFTTKPVGQGTGMGLAMVYGTIHHHNGWVQVKSAPGEGTVFFLFLPIEKESETTAEA